MSVKLNASVGSIDGIIANLFASDERMQAAVRRVVKRNGKRLKALTEKYCPYDNAKPASEFHMQDNVRLQMSDDDLVARVGFLRKDFTKAGYAPYYKFVWFGTVNQTANPFPDRAQNETYPQFKAELGAEVKAAVRRKGGR